ncbi:MAG TPA: DNA polymerase III subunit alpha [Candidatus Paceibacterota bacterium]|nr:DNA polymerase III subunit alpha [Candidatus Paceibacterota bacterium]
MSLREFVHLHTHSHYSLLEALPQIPDLVAAAKADGQTALALTDNGNMYGAIEFYKECKKAGIKPIMGVDFFVAPRTRHDKEHRIDDRTSRLVLLAKNETGYHNLIELVSKGYMEGFYYRPRVDRALLEQYQNGLIAILPSFGGEHAHALKDGVPDRARESLAWYRKLYGEDCFVEITHHPEIEGHEVRMQKILELARGERVEPVAAHDTYYLKAEDGVARELVNKIRTGGTLSREFEQSANDFSFISQVQANKLFINTLDALDNTVKIAHACNVELNLGTWLFPSFPIPSGTTHDSELRDLVYTGFEMRQVEQSPEIVTRVDYELSVISKKGYAPYFLVVADLLRYARRTGIFTNTRGSAAGSLVSYLSGITTVNPLEYQLPFERFLNPERPSPPDIDMDIADNKRDMMIDYARQKYGTDHVAQVGTFGTMMARAAVRDVARALGLSYGIGDKIAKLIPFGKQGFPVTIAGSLENVPELMEVYKNDSDAREVLDMAQKIEGNARHVGVHAAGVVIAPTPITDFVPIQLDPKGGKTITQYDMHAVEDAGLLKFDFLGLTNLSVLADSVERVRERLGVTVDIDRLPPNDTKTFEMLARGETLGVFQMASDGMTNYLMQLKPTRIDDLNVMVALYRPGPMNNIDEYIARKNGSARITYLHPKMESYLAKTFGVLVYQDDLLMTAIELAGYSWGEVDKFRKAVGKKIPEEMAKQHVIFVDGCVKHTGMSKADGERLWNLFEPFQGYGFNKAHAASYGNLAYQTAYMKANFPVDYMAALLTADAGETEKIAETVAECKRMGIDVLPPSVSESMGDFTVVQVRLAQEENEEPECQEGPTHVIRFGLYSIKNFGTGVADSIIAARNEGGAFTDIADFLARVPDKNLNKKSLESLIQSGALDEFGERGNLLANIELILGYHREHMNAPTDQGSLFSSTSLGIDGPAKLKLPPSPPAPMETKLLWEKELLGLYISGHPLDKHRGILSKQKMDLKTAKETFPRGADTVIAGFLAEGRTILTKNGEKMLFAKLTDFSDGVEVVFFPRTYKESEKLLLVGTCIAIKGRFSERNGETSFMAEKVKGL